MGEGEDERDVRDWESANPNELDLSEMFRDIHSDDPRIQYEGIAGAWMVARKVPDRLEDRVPEVIGLLGNLPDTDYGKGSRQIAAETVAEILVDYPEYVEDVVGLLDSDSKKEREEASLAIYHVSINGSAGVLVDYATEITPYVDDSNGRVRENIRLAVGLIGNEDLESVMNVVPDIIEDFEEKEDPRTEIATMGAVAQEYPSEVFHTTPKLIEILESDFSVSTLKSGSKTIVFPEAKYVLDPLRGIAEEYPEEVSPAEEKLRELSTADTPEPIVEDVEAILDLIETRA